MIIISAKVLIRMYYGTFRLLNISENQTYLLRNLSSLFVLASKKPQLGFFLKLMSIEIVNPLWDHLFILQINFCKFISINNL